MIWNETTHFKKHGEQLAAFVSTTQLVRYSHVKGYPGTLYTHTVAVKTDNQYQTWRPPRDKKKLLAVLKLRAFLYKKTTSYLRCETVRAKCADHNNTYFVFFIFVVYANHENIFTTNFPDLQYL